MLFSCRVSSFQLREAFVSSDAAMLLRYVPKSYHVLLVGKFRLGPFVRGDQNLWTFEPVTGMVDANETPQ